MDQYNLRAWVTRTPLHFNPDRDEVELGQLDATTPPSWACLLSKKKTKLFATADSQKKKL
jgi:hypothetical protein